MKSVKTAAETFVPNPKIDVARVISELGVGEALVSFLDEKGRPNVVERAFVVPPGSRLGPLTDAERAKVIDGSLVAGHYEKSVDRESAYEQLAARAAQKTPPAQQQPAAPGGLGGILDSLGLPGGNGAGRGRTREGALEAAAKSAARAMGSEVGRRIIRGVLGSILGGKR
jgi:DNA helicase HerA-like ATPase